MTVLVHTILWFVAGALAYSMAMNDWYMTFGKVSRNGQWASIMMGALGPIGVAAISLICLFEGHWGLRWKR